MLITMTKHHNNFIHHKLQLRQQIRTNKFTK